ncbi:MAG TPA: hypothetical protein VH437_14860 [Terriglobales bacterium]
MTRDDLTSTYAIIRHNIRTYRSAGVVEVVKGKLRAESTLRKLETWQDSTDHHEGWRYFIERSHLKAGTDPRDATRHRQAEFERQESEGLRKKKTPIAPA